jgi:hypothetical protein
MKKYERYTDDQLNERYDVFMKVMRKFTSPERFSLLEVMYSEENLGPSLIMSPASSRPYFHNAYVGGYMDHILHVVKVSLKLAKMYESLGGTLNFTKDELAFSAFHHDLGKLGTVDEPYYILNDSKWHIENRKEYFKPNPNLEFVQITDRSFFLLQQFGISITENEFMGIRLADGMYEEPNKSYLVRFEEDRHVRRTISNILHWADHMATTIEKESDYM